MIVPSHALIEWPAEARLRINCCVIAAFAPAQLLQTSQKRRDFDACLRIALGNLNEHADAPHPLALLRPRREWPRDRRASEERDEFSPVQWISLVKCEPYALVIATM